MVDLNAAYDRREMPGQTARTRRMGREDAPVLNEGATGSSNRRLSSRGHPQASNKLAQRRRWTFHRRLYFLDHQPTRRGKHPIFTCYKDCMKRGSNSR